MLYKGTWLVAFSTGPDSMALVRMCEKKKVKFACAFVNYHHRSQAQEEEEYARNYCKSHGIVLHVLNKPFDDTIGNFEEEARNWRYDFFASLVKTYGYEGVLVGHHMEDYIETYFLQKEKNTIPSVYGLATSSYYKDMLVVRPLLFYHKQDLKNMLDQEGVRYYIDHTNFDIENRRNYYRHVVIKNFSEQQYQKIIKEIHDKNEDLKQKRNLALLCFSDHQTIIKRKYIQQSIEVRLLALRMLIEEKCQKERFAKGFFEDLDHVVMQHEDFLVPYEQDKITYEFSILNDEIFIRIKPKPYAYTVSCVNEVKNLQSPYFKVEEGEKGVYAVTVQKDDFPLTIRNFKTGDKITLQYGTKKVSRFFIDRKIPLCLRFTYPIVENCKRNIILVPQIGCDVAHYSIRPDFNVLQLSICLGKEGKLKNE